MYSVSPLNIPLDPVLYLTCDPYREMFWCAIWATMAQDHGLENDHRPAIVRYITWGFILLQFYKSLVTASPDSNDEFLLCRQCGHEIAKASELTHVPSSEAKYQRNDTILGVPGVLIQLFENPFGTTFEVITAKVADVYNDKQAVSAYSWFPGFSWSMCKCPRCGFHLGWAFHPHDHPPGETESEKSFIGLILENLLHKDYADALLITPKFQNS